MPLPPRIGETISPTTVQPALLDEAAHLCHSLFPLGGVADDAAFADRRPARLELRLDQSHQPGAGRGERKRAREAPASG